MADSGGTPRRFRPTLWLTVFAGGVFLVLVGLGVWQLQRLAWKEELIATRTARLAAPPLVDPAAVEPHEYEFRRIRLEGVFLHPREMLLAARSLRGNVGYHVITPLRLTDGAVVLVNRGWVPHERRDPAGRSEGQVPGQVEVEGIVRGEDQPGIFTPDNDPAGNVWFYVDLDAMAARAGLDRVLPFIVEAGPAENPGGLPIGGQTRTEIRSEHLQYAITWFGLAAALAVIYVVYGYQRPDLDEG